MNYSDSELAADIDRVKRIPIVPTLLDVICETTAMGFAAVARVTQDRWITCTVRDDIQFGLVTGSELKVETTICNEIRDSHQPVIIEHVEANKHFFNHHTPLMYGFQSYISFPIILKTGEFFGTLCAIDPKPAQLENTKIIGMFAAFSDLISFHLQQLELLEQSDNAVKNLSRQLTHSVDENRQYRHISNHNLQEPLRKLRLFSGMLVDVVRKKDIDKAEELALKISAGAEKFSMMIKDLSAFSILDEEVSRFERTDVNEIVALVQNQLSAQLKAKKATMDVGELPSLSAIPQQLEQLFYHILHNAIKFSKKDVPLSLSIRGQAFLQSGLNEQLPSGNETHYVEIQIADNGIGIEASQLEKIFDLFSQLPQEKARQGEGFGLAYCRKIIRNHFGFIHLDSEVGQGTTVSIILPAG
ncbi:sensor histidine kinase [Spirosoma aerolatum]|uniref:sensor histidine kinase n=1 Tax=Spirosoma aerolatum TaxID=1211326 RepID=UPI0009ACAC60|nr:ATP-binding protein [Spirosoma aerolatum]